MEEPQKQLALIRRWDDCARRGERHAKQLARDGSVARPRNGPAPHHRQPLQAPHCCELLSNAVRQLCARVVGTGRARTPVTLLAREFREARPRKLMVLDLEDLLVREASTLEPC